MTSHDLISGWLKPVFCSTAPQAPASTGGGQTVVRDTPHGPCPVVPRRAGQLTCTLHRGHGQASHALTRWNAPASLVPPSVPTLTFPRSSPGYAGQWSLQDRARPVGCVGSWPGVSHRVASPGTATAGGFQVGAGCSGWSCVSFLASVWYGWVGAWWLSRRCCTHPVWRARGKAIHRWGLAGVGRIAQIFFGQCGDLAVSRAYTYQTPHSCVGHNP